MIAAPIVELNTRQMRYFKILAKMATDDWSNLDNDRACEAAQLLRAIEVIAALQEQDDTLPKLCKRVYEYGQALRLDPRKVKKEGMQTVIACTILKGL